MNKTFFADEKFHCIASELSKRGWDRIYDKAEATISWTNLINTDFDLVNFKILNHLKGSQHLSNKVYKFNKSESL
jgi:hypothetical protein